MIITPSKDSKLIPTLVEFAYAEYGSALEMLAAAKLTSSPKLKVGYISHALDEYRHAQLILKIIDTQLGVSSVTYEKGFRFLPLNVVQKGYVDKDGFLVEKLKNRAFVEFVFCLFFFSCGFCRFSFFSQTKLSLGCTSESKDFREIVAKVENMILSQNLAAEKSCCLFSSVIKLTKYEQLCKKSC